MRRGEGLAAHYASADLFVFPSLTETFGNVTIEALASGLPVLAFDTAAAGDWVRHGHNGWLLPVDDAAGFVLALGKNSDFLPATASVLPPLRWFRRAHNYLYITTAAVAASGNPSPATIATPGP